LGQPAWSVGESADQQSAIARIKKPQRKRERLMGVVMFRIFIVFGLICYRFHPCLREPPSSSREAGIHPSSEECSYSFWLNQGSSCIDRSREAAAAAEIRVHKFIK
jgi:hypothetical protein